MDMVKKEQDAAEIAATWLYNKPVK